MTLQPRESYLSSSSEWLCCCQARQWKGTFPSRPPRQAPSCWWPLSRTAAAKPQCPGASTKCPLRLSDCEGAKAKSTFRIGEKYLLFCFHLKVWLFFFKQQSHLSHAPWHFKTLRLCSPPRTVRWFNLLKGHEVAALLHLSLPVSVFDRPERHCFGVFKKISGTFHTFNF